LVLPQHPHPSDRMRVRGSYDECAGNGKAPPSHPSVLNEAMAARSTEPKMIVRHGIGQVLGVR
jgi:hypothetical protein